MELPWEFRAALRTEATGEEECDGLVEAHSLTPHSLTHARTNTLPALSQLKEKWWGPTKLEDF